jgi:hypothetical protein
MNWDLLLTVTGSGTGGAIIIKFIEYYLLPKKDKKEFDEKVRDELWDRVKNLEGRIDEQNKMIVDLIKENAVLRIEVTSLRNENKLLKES